MKQTAATSITTFDVIGLTIVYGPTNFVPATVGGWNTLVLSLCFVWDGTSNILIDQCHANTAANKATAGAQTQYSTTAFNSSICTGGAAITCGTTTGTTYTNRPNTQVTLTHTLPDVAAVGSNLVSANIILNQFTTPTIVVQNNSCHSISTMQVGYKFNGTVVNETFTPATPIAPAATATYTFTTPATPIALGFANLKLWVDHPDGVIPDINTPNDTLNVNNCFVINDPAALSTSYTGTDFWLAFMLNDDNGVANPLYQVLYLSTSAGATNVTITTPNLSPAFSTTVAVNSNSVTSIIIPNTVAGVAIGTSTINSVQNTGIHLVGSTTVPFTVYGLSRQKFTADGFLAIPTSALGKDYLIVEPSNGNPGEFVITATQNGTTAKITIPAAIPLSGHATTFTTPVMNAGQTYLMNAKTNTEDITGIRVTANNPISILEGGVCAMIGHTDLTFLGGNGTTTYTDASGTGSICGYCDHVNEQAIPILSCGKHYFINDLADKDEGSIIRVVNLAASGTNNYTVTGQVAQSFSGMGSYKDFVVKTACEIKADSTIYVMMFTTGALCNTTGNNTDPMIMNILPQEQWGNAYSFISPTSAIVGAQFTEHYVNILKKGTGKVALDGVFLPSLSFPEKSGPGAGTWRQLGVTGIYYGSFILPVVGGFHTLIGDSTISAYAYGFTTDDAYGYPASGAALAAIAVPIGLSSFTAQLDQKNVITQWTTATETNNDYFIVERSVDGINYTEASKHIPGAGNSEIKRNYSFIDNNPVKGSINYYRLHQVDYNGTTSLSNIVAITVAGQAIVNFSLTPIPAKDFVNLVFNASADDNIILKVFDVTGKIVIQRIMHTQEGNNNTQLDISSLENGAYFVQLGNDNGYITRGKLIKVSQ
jgi:hypothetical protein